jgi:hypothetical protein
VAVRISRLEIDSCGPITRFHEKIAPLTVVYGANERGKTTIVENVVAALFRERRDGLVPAGRGATLGSARVHVTGLGRRAEVFSPLDKRRRLDELLLKQNAGLPASLFGLLVVRAGETEIAAGRGGLDKSLLKGLLSQQKIYEQIAAGLPGEVAYTELTGGRVLAQRRIGAYKAHEEALQRLRGLEALAEELSSSLSETGAQELRARRARLAELRDAQGRARRHSAFSVNRRIRASEAHVARLDGQVLRQLASQVQEHDRLAEELAGAGKDGEGLAAVQAESRWLEEAQRRWGQGRSRVRGALHHLALGLCALFLLGAIASSLFLPGLLPLALALSLAALLLVALSSLAGRPGPQADGELQALRQEFQERFGRAPTTPADFAAARSELDRRLGRVEQAQNSRRRTEERLAALQGEIRGSLLRFREAEPGIVADPARRLTTDPAGWGALVRRLAETRSRHELEAQRLRERLESLGVDESDYLEEDPGTPFSREVEAAIAAEIEDVEARLRERENQAAGLRQRLAAHLGPDFAGQTLVKELAVALETRRAEEEAAARGALASIIAGHVVKDVLAEFRRAEDEELERSLNDPRLSGLLARLTGRYDRLHLEGERLLVGNEEELYDLREMSTGAREQVLLALRLGLAAALSGRETLFLLLDDAFQHSDWQRRGGLVEQAVATVQEGWQVIYFTMDDDIRRRFVEAAKVLPDGQFRLIEL